jgi:hypothetical protein
VRTDPRLAQTPKQNTLMNWRVPSHERFIADRFAGKTPPQRSGFGKITLQRADLKIPAQIGADPLRGRHGT